MSVTLIPKLQTKIYQVRGQRVMLDSDLAELYGVTTTRLNEQVKRNSIRFPNDFSFVLDNNDLRGLMSQIATSNGRGGRRKATRVFTEHGAVMLASVLNSPQAVAMSLLVVRAFVELRTVSQSHLQIARKIKALEKQLATHDDEITELFSAIHKLIKAEPVKKTKIGYIQQ